MGTGPQQEQSPQVLEDVKVTFRGQEESFGNLQPGASSAYRKVTSSFRYGLSEATVGGKRVKLEPLDFFHEKLLPPGDYTWGLAPEGTEHLVLTVIAPSFAARFAARHPGAAATGAATEARGRLRSGCA